jgi:hypothetical protein
MEEEHEINKWKKESVDAEVEKEEKKEENENAENKDNEGENNARNKYGCALRSRRNI